MSSIQLKTPADGLCKSDDSLLTQPASDGPDQSLEAKSHPKLVFFILSQAGNDLLIQSYKNTYFVHSPQILIPYTFASFVPFISLSRTNIQIKKQNKTQIPRSFVPP